MLSPLLTFPPTTPLDNSTLPSLSIFAEVGVTDLRSDVELGRLDLQLGGLIDCCSFRARSEYQVSHFMFGFMQSSLNVDACMAFPGFPHRRKCAWQRGMKA